ncbi:MAG: hypothetical protein M3Z27_01190, partial [Actinomycetota bacterium]|nr:hypothetical protein [Actinomycetota bacterium]
MSARFGILRGARAVWIAAAIALLAAGCGAAARQLPAQTHPAPRARVPGGPPRHVAVIVMENE